MLFTSFDFLVFLPIVLIVFFLIPPKTRYIWLVVVSFFFYMYLDPLYVFLILFPTILTYMGGLYIEDNKMETKRKKYILTLCIFSILMLLGVFKYTNFMIDIVNVFIKMLFDKELTQTTMFLPIGISFYTFQTIGYLIDVYRGDVKAERNIIRYALFVTFFPQLVAGPIERSKSLLNQLRHLDRIKANDFKRIESGVIIILYGYFLKLVIADRASILVDNVFAEYYLYGSVELILAAVLFAIQIYTDFCGYTSIAIGIAQVMGVELMDNFNCPYFSISIKDFWSRWHISLSTWFRDYLYIPLGGNRKGKIRTAINKLIVFSLSGLWHGASWHFVVWGMLHGIGQIIEDSLGKIVDIHFLKNKVNKTCFSWKLLKITTTFIFVSFAWIFFRAESVKEAFCFIRTIFEKNDIWRLFDGGIYMLGLDILEMNILLLSILFVLFVDGIRYVKKKTIDSFVVEQNMYFRILIIIGLLLSIIIFGKYGSGFDANSFIYFQF